MEDEQRQANQISSTDPSQHCEHKLNSNSIRKQRKHFPIQSAHTHEVEEEMDDAEHRYLSRQSRPSFETTLPVTIKIDEQAPDIHSPFLTSVPGKRFKRHRSYITGRHVNKRADLKIDDDYSKRAKKSRDNLPSWARKRDKYSDLGWRSLHADNNLTQEEKELAALSRLNYLNMKLKGHQNTTGSSKDFENEKSYNFAIEPDPPSWSYESYSESDRRENTLPGLRSYIRSNEGKLGICGKENELEEEDEDCSNFPPESLVAYLDGVLTPRFMVRKCSLSLDNEYYSDNLEEHTRNTGHRRHHSHKRRSSKHRKERNHSKKDCPRRSSSLERCRTLEIDGDDIFAEDPVLVKRTGTLDDTYEDTIDEQRLRTGNREALVSMDFAHAHHARSEDINVGSRENTKERLQSPGRICKNSCRDADTSIKTRKNGFSRGIREKSPAFDLTQNVLKNDNKLKKGQDVTESKRDYRTRTLSNLAKKDGFNLHIPVADSGTFELPSQHEEESAINFEKTKMQPSRVGPPVLQAQESPLAVADSYIMSDVNDTESSDISYDGNQPTTPKRRRLVVKKDRASARIWTFSKSGQNSFHTLFPYGDYSMEDNDEDDQEDDSSSDDEEDKDEVNGEGKNEKNHEKMYEDLIIQTELSEGSKVRLSNSDGPIAAIEHENGNESERKQFQIMKYKPDSGEIDILSKHILSDTKGNRLCNKSQNNERREKSDISFNKTSRSGTMNNQFNGKTFRNKKRQSSPKPVNTNHHPLSQKTKEQISSSPSVFDYRSLSPHKSREIKRTSPALSPPKPTPVRSPAQSHHDGSSLTQKKKGDMQVVSLADACDDGPEELTYRDEQEIPISYDGKTRVLLVIRTPPKGSKDGTRTREKIVRRSTERKVQSSSPNKMPQQRSPTGEKLEPDKTKPRLSNKKNFHEQTTLIKDSRTGFGDNERRELFEHPPETDGRLYIPRYDYNSSTANLKQARRSKRQSSRYKFDSMLPKPCGQETNSQFILKGAEQLENEDIKHLVVGSPLEDENVSREEASINHKLTIDADETEGVDLTTDACQSLQDRINTHGPCKFSRYQPCQHDGDALQRNNPVTSSAKFEKLSLLQKEKKSKKTSGVKGLVTDHDPCLFSRFQPCNHATHSPCQFGRFEPCRHEECERPETLKDISADSDFFCHSPKYINLRKAPETNLCKFDRYHPCQHDESNDILTENSRSALMKKLSPKAKRSGYKYNSKSLQSKLGQHSPCVFDRYKPCLHEECLGPLDQIKNLSGVSLLSHASKTFTRSDSKSKTKEANPNTSLCRFNPYTPCFHEEEIKFNRALGRKASLRPEKPKVPQPDAVAAVSQEAVDPCKFNRFRPCFCQETIESLKTERLQTVDTTEAEAPTQHPRQKSKSIGSKSIGDAASKEKKDNVEGVVGTVETARGKPISSLQNRKDKEKTGKSTLNALARQAADGPDVKICVPPTPPVANSAIGAGDSNGLKPENDDDKADEETSPAGGLSLISRISRAWFSSAQAQVARLAPPQRILVPPALRSDKSLGCNTGVNPFIGVSEEQTETKFEKPSVTTIASAATSHEALHPNHPKSPRKYSTSRSAGSPIIEQTMEANNPLLTEKKTWNQKKKMINNQGKAHFGERMYELSLADSNNIETFDVETSQGTEIPELSGWTMSRDQAGIQQLGESDVDMLSVTETCCGKSDSTGHYPASRQIWRTGGAIPEDFLVLTSNLYPEVPDFQKSGGSGRTSKVVDTAGEVLSADPLPMHFSDIARANRFKESSRGQLLKDHDEKFYRSQAGFALCNSSQTSKQWAREKSPSNKANVQVMPTFLGVLNQNQHLSNMETPMDNVKAFLKNHAKETKDKEKSDADVTFTTCGDKSADPLPHNRHPYLNRRNQRNASTYDSAGAADQQVSDHKEIIYGVRDCANSLHLEEQAANAIDGAFYQRSKNGDSDFEETVSSEQLLVNGENGSTDLSSKEKQAVVVAAAELASYKSLLDTITKIARVSSSLNTESRMEQAQTECVDEPESCRWSTPGSSSDSYSSSTGSDGCTYSTVEELELEEEDHADSQDGDDDVDDEDEDDSNYEDECCEKLSAGIKSDRVDRKDYELKKSNNSSSCIKIVNNIDQQRPLQLPHDGDQFSQKNLYRDEIFQKPENVFSCDGSDEKGKSVRETSDDVQEFSNAGRNIKQYDASSGNGSVMNSMDREGCLSGCGLADISDTLTAKFVFDNQTLGMRSHGAGIVQNVCNTVKNELRTDETRTIDTGNSKKCFFKDDSENREKLEDIAPCETGSLKGENNMENSDDSDDDSDEDDDDEDGDDDDDETFSEDEETDERDEVED